MKHKFKQLYYIFILVLFNDVGTMLYSTLYKYYKFRTCYY